MFYVGQKVVCIEITFAGSHSLAMQRVRKYGINLPTVRDVYTVSRLGEEKGMPVVHLCEIGNWHLAPHIYPEPPGYPSRWFRPAVERKTDISIFTDMLNPSDERVSA
jgi:hypothetical protein